MRVSVQLNQYIAPTLKIKPTSRDVDAYISFRVAPTEQITIYAGYFQLSCFHSISYGCFFDRLLSLLAEWICNCLRGTLFL